MLTVANWNANAPVAACKNVFNMTVLEERLNKTDIEKVLYLKVYSKYLCEMKEKINIFKSKLLSSVQSSFIQMFQLDLYCNIYRGHKVWACSKI